MGDTSMRVPNTGKTPRVEKLVTELEEIMGERMVEVRIAGPIDAERRALIARMDRTAAAEANK